MWDKKKDLGDASLGPDEMLHTVAEDLLDSIKTGDTSGVVQALKAFLSVVQALDLEQDEAGEAE